MMITEKLSTHLTQIDKNSKYKALKIRHAPNNWVQDFWLKHELFGPI